LGSQALNRGQPAGTGIGSGAASAVKDQTDLFSFKMGNALACDAVNPKMIF